MQTVWYLIFFFIVLLLKNMLPSKYISSIFMFVFVLRLKEKQNIIIQNIKRIVVACMEQQTSKITH